MRYNRLQNRIAESTFTLPICALLTTLLWWWPKGEYSLEYMLGWGVCALSTYVLTETNNSNILIRIRTRMVCCVWLIGTSILGFLHPLSNAVLAAFCLIVSHYLLFKSYQLHQPVVWVFHSYLFLGLGSIAFPWMLAFAMLYYWYLAVMLRAISWRSFWAGIVGLLIPYWFWGVGCLMLNDLTPLTEHLMQLTEWNPITLGNYQHIPQVWIASWGLFTLLALIGGVHFLITSFNDKIQVRMLLYIFVVQTLVVEIFMVLQPQHFQPLMAMLLACCCPLIAHFFSLTGSRLSNLLFCITLIMVIALAIWNLWMPSFSL